MPETISRNLSELLRLAFDAEHAQRILDIAIASATDGGFGDSIRGILWVTYAHLADALHASVDEPKRVRVKTALRVVEAELVSHGAPVSAGEIRQAV